MTTTDIERKKGIHRITVYAPSELHKALRLRSVQEDRSMNEIIRNLILRYLHTEAGSEPFG